MNFKKFTMGPVNTPIASLRPGSSCGAILFVPYGSPGSVYVMFDQTDPAVADVTDGGTTVTAIGKYSLELRPGALYETPDYVTGRIVAAGELTGSVLHVTVRDEKAFTNAPSS